MRYALCLLLPLMFSSCATMFNTMYSETTFRSNKPATVIVDYDTLVFNKNNRIHTIQMERSKEYKEITVIRDASVDTVVLRPSWDYNYSLNSFTFGLGFIIDGKTLKKWTYYPGLLSNNYIKNNSKAIVYKYSKKEYIEYSQKGIANLRVSLPRINHFNFAYEGQGRRSNGGFVGLSLGLDYFYKDNAFINVSVAGIVNAFSLILVPITCGGIHDHMASAYGSASNNHMLAKNRLSIGYGISFGHDVWNTINHGRWSDDATEEEVMQEDIFRRSNSLGLVVPVYYYTRRSFYMGLVYRPMFLQFADKTRFKYQHTASFDFGWRIRLKK